MKNYAWAIIYLAASLVVTSALAIFLPKYSGFLMLFFFLLLADGRLWLSVRKQLGHINHWKKCLAGLLFLSPAILISIALITGLIIPFTDWPIPFRTHLVNTILILYLVKLFPVTGLLLSDFIRLFGYLTSKVFTITVKPLREGCRLCVGIGWALGVIAGLILFYGTICGLFDFRVNRLEVKLKDLPPSFDGFRIVQISDLHLGSWTSKNELGTAVDSILSLRPDLIVFTGDMFNYRTSEGNDFQHILKRIKAPYGVFAILGNHDYGDYMTWPDSASKRQNMVDLLTFYNTIGWELLLNEHRYIRRGEDSIVIAGVENWGATHRFQRKGDVAIALSGAEQAAIQVLLSHDPSHWDSIVSNQFPAVDLTLSGHTHGGQVGLSNAGQSFSPSAWVYPHWSGLYKKNQDTKTMYLYVNQGLGTIGYTGRLNMPPEISLLVLKQW